MATTPFQRAMFEEGGKCFFCTEPIPIEQRSVEHLVPKSKGGGQNPDNLVACCQTLNTIMRDMSLKEKIRLILKQKGDFRCPNAPVQPQKTQQAANGAAKPNVQAGNGQKPAQVVSNSPQKPKMNGQAQNAAKPQVTKPQSGGNVLVPRV